MERPRRILGCDVLCNRMCFSDAECEHEMRLIPCKVQCLKLLTHLKWLAELLPDNKHIDHEAEERMYQLGKNSAGQLHNNPPQIFTRSGNI